METSTCSTCGFKWETGKDGSHQCSDWLLKRIVRLENELRNEGRIIELLIVGGFVRRDKAEEARQLLTGVD